MAFMRHNNNGGRRHNHNNRHRGPNNNGGHGNSQHSNNAQGQNGQRRHVNRINMVFDSNGPDGRIRGTAQQIVEKFTSLARDAQVSGDKVLMQNYYQHAEHYQRLANEILEENASFEREREQQRQQQQAQQPDFAATENTESFAAATPEAAAAVTVSAAPAAKRVDDLEDTSSLPSFVQVPISSGTPEASESARPTLKPRQPRRPAATGTDDKSAE